MVTLEVGFHIKLTSNPTHLGGLKAGKIRLNGESLDFESFYFFVLRATSSYVQGDFQTQCSGGAEGSWVGRSGVPASCMRDTCASLLTELSSPVVSIFLTCGFF